MKVQRLLGSLAIAGTLTALSAGFAVPAVAAGNVTFTNITPSDQSVLPGSLSPNQIPVHVDASCTDTLCSVSGLSVVISDPAPGNNTGNTVASSAAGSGASSLDYSWDLTSTAKRNGVYRITFNAQENVIGGGLLGGGPASTQVQAKVNLPPSAPTGVKATLDSSNVPVVTWNKNPEPDISGYELFRVVNGGSPQPITSATDSSAPQGQSVTYIVVAVRSSPVWSSGITSCNGAPAPCTNPPTSQQSAAVAVPAPPGSAGSGQAVPQNVATVDPPPAPKGAGGTAGSPSALPKQPLTFVHSSPTPIAIPSAPTQITIAPAPNVVQFAPLLPYSGKVPEVAVSSNVPAPVQAASSGDNNAQPAINLPAGIKLTPVNAVKYVATAVFLIVAAIHITRFARKLRNAPV